MTDPFDGDDATETPTPPSAPAPLTLYRVDGRGRINLSGVVAEGTEFYTAHQADGGQILLSPVQVATTSIKRNTLDQDALPGV